eukprot:gene6012-6250_t
MEATIVCIDNSEWTRSGDYAPTRFQAQADAVNLLAGAKTQANPENTVGVLIMAGKTPRVLVTPTPDLGKVLNSMTDIVIEGESNIATSVQIAQLALKHRQNKNQRQRIVIFAGSPVKEDKDALVKIAKKLKKNNVAVDVVSFGHESENEDKLSAFHAAINSNDNSHLVVVPPGPVLSDVLIGSPIFQKKNVPGKLLHRLPLVMVQALQMELWPVQGSRQQAAVVRQRLVLGVLLGLVDEPTPAAGPTPAAPSKPAGGNRDALMLDGDIDDDLQKALALSMQDVVEPSAAATPAPAVDGNQAIAGLPGVDPDDPGVQAALRNVEQGGKQGNQEDSNDAFLAPAISLFAANFSAPIHKMASLHRQGSSVARIPSFNDFGSLANEDHVAELPPPLSPPERQISRSWSIESDVNTPRYK